MNARVLRESLMQSFPSNQATVLADAFTEAFAEAFAAQDRVFDEMGTLRREVTRMAQEVTQLAEAQGRLAEAQGRTEMRVEQLAEARNAPRRPSRTSHGRWEAHWGGCAGTW